METETSKCRQYQNIVPYSTKINKTTPILSQFLHIYSDVEKNNRTNEKREKSEKGQVVKLQRRSNMLLLLLSVHITCIA